MTSNARRKTKVKDESDDRLTAELNEFASRPENAPPTDLPAAVNETAICADAPAGDDNGDDDQYQEQIRQAVKNLYDRAENEEFTPSDFQKDIPIDSLESCVGYTSLIRQMHNAFVQTVAYYRSEKGGSLSIEEARRRAFHPCADEEAAIKELDSMMALPVQNLSFADLLQLYSFAPRVAEGFWEKVKKEGRAEFESGHLAANITFPEGYMKQLWNIARYLGVRESFIDDWNPQGGIEIAMIDMLTQSYFQWQYWLEQTVKRSETRPREEHHAYQEWKQSNQSTKNARSWESGYWFPSYVSEQQDIEHAVQMADTFNRTFMRILRQLRDLRRYSPVTINHPNQVNIATDGGQQLNVNNSDGS